jgi:hypothetical protein
MKTMNNKNRAGKFTSSMVYKLIKEGRGKDEFSVPGLTYIQEKAIERKMQSCLDGGAHTQTLAWGNFMELMVYSILGVQYQISSKETTLHPKYGEFWSGSKDLFTVNAETGKMESIAEIKCYQKKNFALYTDCILKKDIELFKNDFPKEYWQIVSNACLENVEIGEAITYMPYVSEYEEIKEMAENYEGADFWKYKFIRDLPVEDLPFLPDNGYYKNINKFAFIVPQDDKDFLESRVLLAEEKIKEYL